MKKVMLLCFIMICPFIWAQKGNGVGIKAGLNYNSNGDYINNIGTVVEDPSKNIGFHIGVFGKLDLGALYIRPEAIYTRTNSEYKSGDLIISKIDVPLLAGIDLLGPISVFAGPSLQYILKNEFEDFTLEEAEKNFTVGAQFGVALNFKSLGFDLRYERGLSKNEAQFTDISQNRIDTRPDQLIFGVSVKL